MSENNELPTTNRYKLGVNINLEHAGLCKHFSDCATHHSSQDTIKKLIHSLTGRDDVNLLYFEDKGTNAYHAKSDTIILTPSQARLERLMYVSKDNMPPNIPKEFTPELLAHLVALHESEHVTQFALEKQDTDVTNVKSTILTTRYDTFDLQRDIAEEADADLAVIKHLKDMDLHEVSQLWKDMRSVGSFVLHFPLPNRDGLEHDTTAIVNHFEETGEALDPDHLIDEKLDLMSKIHDRLGINRDFLSTMIALNMDKAPDENKILAKLNEEETTKDIFIRPQQIMTAVQSLLQEGSLTGLQKREAENYIDAMNRMGYTPEPVGDYTTQAANAMKKHFGFTIPDKTLPVADKLSPTDPGTQNPAPPPAVLEPQAPVEAIQPLPTSTPRGPMA